MFPVLRTSEVSFLFGLPSHNDENCSQDRGKKAQRRRRRRTTTTSATEADSQTTKCTVIYYCTHVHTTRRSRSATPGRQLRQKCVCVACLRTHVITTHTYTALSRGALLLPQRQTTELFPYLRAYGAEQADNGYCTYIHTVRQFAILHKNLRRPSGKSKTPTNVLRTHAPPA